MKQMIAVVLDQDAEQATKALLESGVVDFIDMKEIPADWTDRLRQEEPPKEQQQMRELRSRLDSLFRTAGRTPASAGKREYADITGLSLDRAEETVDDFAETVRRVREEQRKVQEELNRLRELRRQMPAAGVEPALAAGSHSYIRVRTGTVPDEQREGFRSALGEYAALYIETEGAEEDRAEALIHLRRDDDRIERLLQRFGWQDHRPGKFAGEHRRAGESEAQEGGGGADRPPGKEADRRIEQLQQRQEELQGSLPEEVAKREEELGRVWTFLRVGELSSTIRSFYRRTERTYLFSGWLPADKRPVVEERLLRVTEGRIYLEWHDPMDADDPEVAAAVPVQMENPKLLRPFQALVENYAVPAYGTVDPTPFVAVFYLAMFGLMFADVGHGAVVMLSGIIGSRIMQRRGKETMLFPLITWCGAAAILTGALFGSYFGMGWLPPLWFDYHGIVAGHGGSGSVRSLTDILVITIYFGITVIAVGLLLNWVNRIRRREWFALVWENGGLLVGWLYTAGTYCAFYFVRHDYRELPEAPLLFGLLGVPVIVLGAKPVLERLRQRRHGEAAAMNPVDMVMEWLVELLEIFSGYLSNTLSFMRVAGLGIAHVSLMIAFFQIAGMAASEGGGFTIWSYLILLAGNALVIGLEGLSAGIQSLRLNYYEFFSKYFSGTGKAYAPISLKG
jgi:V/A-type H+-transporting ATPase subunit I